METFDINDIRLGEWSSTAQLSPLIRNVSCQAVTEPPVLCVDSDTER